MPWRLIIFIVVFAVFLIFITFNLENKCDIGFGFTSLSDVPVFITIFSSFVLGFFCALPLIFHIKKRKTEKMQISSQKKEKPENDDVSDTSTDMIDPAEARKKFLSRKRKTSGSNDK